MMLPAGKLGLVGGRLRQLDPPEESHAREQVERPVDARDAGVPAAGAQGVEDLLGRDAAVLASDLLEHRRARAAAAMPFPAKLASRVLRPLRSLPGTARHAADHSRSTCE